MSLVNDEPTLVDAFGRRNLVRRLGKAVATCQPPYVFGIHGDWGAGKTSFLHQLHFFLTGECPQQSEEQRDKRGAGETEGDGQYADEVIVIWFEAWRYQHESVPIVALLQEIRAQLPWHSKTFAEVRKLGEVAVRSALMAFEDLTKKIGIQASKIQDVGEKLEKENLATSLPSHMIRQHLEATLKQLLGKVGERARRLVVLVDDLDRCESDAAYKLLEGIKIYLNLPSCVFVLGMNQSIIEQAIGKHLSRSSDHGDDESRAQAREYLEKLCHDIWHLPLVADPNVIVRVCIEAPAVADSICNILSHYQCLPANPRKIKAYSNVLNRFIDYVKYGEPLPNETDNVRHASLIVVVSCLYQFHPELYRVMEGDPRFYEALRDRAAGRPVDHELLRSLKAPRSHGGRSPDASETEPTPTPTLVDTYPDPSRGNVLRIQGLIGDLGPIPVSELRRYIIQ